MIRPQPAHWLPPQEFAGTLPKATVYAAMYVTDERDRPVMLRACYAAENWQCPGGNMDPGETPWECAVRETREETGLVITGTRPLLLSHWRDPRESWPYGHIGFVFDGGRLTARELESIVLDPEEHSDWEVHTVEEWRPLMTDRVHARLLAMDTARRTGRAGHLETTV